MASPELWKGLCGICCGTLTPENTLHEDCGDGRGGVHKGVCAYDYGLVAPEHQERYDELIKVVKDAPIGEETTTARQALHKWIHSLDLDDYEWKGPFDA